MLRFVLAFLLAPLPAALLHAILVALWPRPGLGIYQHPVSMFATMCLFHYALGLLLGLPLYLALRRRIANRLRAYALGGLLIVLVPMAIGIGWSLAHVRVPFWSAAYSFLRFGTGGLLTGAAFWLVLRPDRRAVAADKARLSVTFD